MTNLTTDLTRKTDTQLRAWITGDTDWTSTRETASRILDLPDEAYAEAEKRSDTLALLRDQINDQAAGTLEWKSAVDAYINTFVQWVTGHAVG